ncbi:MAG: 3-oxoacyl-[acyl-carrier-protein] reductase [Chloroflexota bacterium]|nr:3-oxoacyl-[acyl-carrier-protein] reductase [Chloroflexota bacterium]
MAGEAERQIVVVTGASRGIGRAVAVRFARDGAAVIVNYRGSEAAAQETARAVNEAGGEATLVQGDVSKRDDAERLIETAIQQYGRIDVLVNNAGITRDQLLMRMTDEDWDAVLDTNLKGAFYTTRAALRPMLRKRSGRIINISSVVGLIGNAGQGNYAAAKAGLIGFTKSVAREVAGRSITVNAIAPGYIATEMTNAIPENLRGKILEQVPMGRLGTPDDVAAVVAFVASPAAAYMTGTVLPVDGGMVMR